MIRTEKLNELNGYIEELKCISKKNIKTNSNFISVNKIQCLLNNKTIIIREQILKNNTNGNASIILPITKENNVLLVVQPRVFTELTVGVELPAGYVEDNEEYIEAAKRELIEETGYVPENIEFITKFYQDQGCSKALNYGFIAYDCEKEHNQQLDKDEFIRYFECTYNEALELIDLGYINDANSLLVLEKSKRYVRK